MSIGILTPMGKFLPYHRRAHPYKPRGSLLA